MQTQTQTQTQPQRRIRLLDSPYPQVKNLAVTVQTLLYKRNRREEFVYWNHKLLTGKWDKGGLFASKNVQSAVKAMLAVDGVVCVAVEPYQFSVEAALACDWKELLNLLVAILRDQLFGGGDVEVDRSQLKSVALRHAGTS